MYHQLTAQASRHLSIMTLTLALLPMGASSGFGNPAGEDKTASTEAPATPQVTCDPKAISALQADQLLLHVEGMVCGMCVQGISKLIGELEGVKGVEIELEAGSVLVTMKPDSKLTEQDFKEAVSKAGYEMRDMHRPPAQQGDK